jgi:rod shape-determining protein MreC
MEYSPPPLFKQGASARAKVVFFSLIAIALLVTDSRVRSLSLIRQVIGSTLYPLQMAALVPRDAFNRAGDYFSSLASLEKENQRLTLQQSVNAQMLQQSQQLYAENAQLRKLLGASERLPAKSMMSEILYDARDAFTRKIVLDRGSQNGVNLGQPVIDDIGVVGQVTRVFPFTAEVTLLTDKDQAISVQVVRNGLRSVAYGRGQSGVLDLKFMATNADIQKGDMLVTSGIDGVFPAGLAVAKVVQVENKSSDSFAHIVCQPTAGIDRNRQLLVLLVDTKAPRMEPEEPKDKRTGRHRAEMVKEAGAENATVSPAPVPPALPAPVKHADSKGPGR